MFLPTSVSIVFILATEISTLTVACGSIPATMGVPIHDSISGRACQQLHSQRLNLCSICTHVLWNGPLDSSVRVTLACDRYEQNPALRKSIRTSVHLGLVATPAFGLCREIKREKETTFVGFLGKGNAILSETSPSPNEMNRVPGRVVVERQPGSRLPARPCK